MLKVNLETRLRRGDLTYLSAMIIMVIMPLHYKYLPPFMIILGLSWILENYSGFGEMLRSCSRYKLLFIVFFVFYLWQILGLFYSSDLKTGWSNVFGRLSIFVFPLILFCPGEKIRTKGFSLLRIFALSTSVYIISCFGYALFRSLSFQNGILLFNPHLPVYDWLNYFYGPDFTYSIHPSYLAIYVLFSVFVSFESSYDSSLKVKYRIGWFILSFFLLVSIYFISSRAAILAVIIIIPLYALNKIIKFQKTRFLWIGIIIVLILSLPLIRKNDRVNNLLNGFSKEKKFDLIKQDERIIIWESAIRIIRKNLTLGVGVGDVRSELVNEYNQIGEDKMSGERLNAHNQFLEILLENGLVGLFIFLVLLGYMIFIALSEKNLLYGLFILMMFIFFMFETVLYRLAGVAFFSLFSFLLLHIPKKEIKRY